MRITSATPLSHPPQVRKQEESSLAPGGEDTYERQTGGAYQRQEMSRKEILEYMRSRGMQI